MKKFYKWTIITLLVCALAITSTTQVEAKGAAKPVINKIIASTSYVNLYWNDNQSRHKYHIYKKVDDGQYKKIATVKGKVKSYKDKKIKIGKRYSYKVVGQKWLKRYSSNNKSVNIKVITAPKLLSATNSYVKNKPQTTLKFKGRDGNKYYIYRKTSNASWKLIKTINGKNGNITYVDKKISKNKTYSYTVKELRKTSKGIYQYSRYNNEGLSIVAIRPTVKASYGNLKTTVKWNKVKGATGYKIYRKIGIKGNYRCIGDTKDTNFIDVYKNTSKTNSEASLLLRNHFLDPTYNPYVYTVRAYKEVGDAVSYGPYYGNGYFYKSQPHMVKVTKKDSKNMIVKWGTVRNANSYYIYSGYKDKSGRLHWKKLKSVKAEDNPSQSTVVKTIKNNNYYTVKARFVVDGKSYYSTYEKDFNIGLKKSNNTNILFIGDSITYGSPYKKSTNKEIFSYPYRLEQLTGANVYNLGIPGASFGLRDGQPWLISDVVEKVQTGINTSKTLHKTNKKFENFDVVVIAAGTNDYIYSMKLGNIDSDNPKEFNGALNYTFKCIQEANKKRANKGKKAIEVVVLDLFYSNRVSDFSKEINRFTTKNKAGYTLKDYQDNIDKIVAKIRRWA